MMPSLHNEMSVGTSVHFPSPCHTHYLARPTYFPQCHYLLSGKGLTMANELPQWPQFLSVYIETLRSAELVTEDKGKSLKYYFLQVIVPSSIMCQIYLLPTTC